MYFKYFVAKTLVTGMLGLAAAGTILGCSNGEPSAGNPQEESEGLLTSGSLSNFTRLLVDGFTKTEEFGVPVLMPNESCWIYDESEREMRFEEIESVMRSIIPEDLDQLGGTEFELASEDFGILDATLKYSVKEAVQRRDMGAMSMLARLNWLKEVVRTAVFDPEAYREMLAELTMILEYPDSTQEFCTRVTLKYLGLEPAHINRIILTMQNM